jgi:hypothetical protein
MEHLFTLSYDTKNNTYQFLGNVSMVQALTILQKATVDSAVKNAIKKKEENKDEKNTSPDDGPTNPADVLPDKGGDTQKGE